MIFGPRSGPWRLGAAAAILTAASADAAPAPTTRIDFIQGEVSVTRYDAAGGSDLLTGGLGAEGLATPPSATFPKFSDPPTVEELRTGAIYFNYRALVDTTEGGGYGRLYGPAAGLPPGSDGKIFGTEYLALAGGEGGDRNITLMVQVPDGFDPNRPCIVAGPSSGSRGVYGAIGTAGEWGLKKGCAVAYTDKGTGIGAHDLEADTVTTLRGERLKAEAAGDRSNFTAGFGERWQAILRNYPHRWAWKHAHSRHNPEAEWGEHVVLSLRLALWALNEQFARSGQRFAWDNTPVIAAGISNGGGAVLRAAEEAPAGMIDGVVASEPNIQPHYDGRFVIQQGSGSRLVQHSRPLYDYISLINVYQGCANRAAENREAPLNPAPETNPALVQHYDNRCQSLADAGLVTSKDPARWPIEAQAVINSYGILKDQNLVQPAYWASYVPQAVAVTYANAYARASVLDNLCGYSFAATDAANRPAPLDPALAARLFATANGIPPTGGVNVINNRSKDGPLLDPLSVSRAFDRADQNLEGALCLRSLQTARARDRDLTGDTARFYRQLQRGIEQVLATGELRGTPTILLHGRSDGLIAPNHTSRPYLALSLLADGHRSRIVYYEVTNAQHFEAFNPLPGFDTRFIPLHYYFHQALDLMHAHLTESGDLPPSQVVRTTPRGGTPGAAPPVTPEANLPPIAPAPPKADQITFAGRILTVPD